MSKKAYERLAYCNIIAILIISLIGITIRIFDMLDSKALLVLFLIIGILLMRLLIFSIKYIRDKPKI